jgi:alanyl-tRNA synthetase
MLTRSNLLDSKNFELKFFKENKFKRQKCKKCNHFFWSRVERDFCGDPPCGEYEFIGNPFIPKKYDWKKMRNEFLKFFEKHKHEKIERYPVVSRWKPDTFYTGASIYCFMPWVLNKTIEPPANPLVMSQPSVRFGDIENVGLGTGRHMSIFEMMAHHAFNYRDDEIYWKEKTVELCDKWLRHLGISESLIVFKENLWEGGGNAGPCFEVIVQGNEVATLVFMEYESQNGTYKKMDLKVVDTGYGLERHVWGSLGSPTIYYGAYPEVIDFIRKQADVKLNKEVSSEFCRQCGILNIEDVNVERVRNQIIDVVSKNLKMDGEEVLKIILADHNIYQIADHTKAIAFILNDGVVPSNVQEGYLARLLIRRSIRSLEDLGLEIKLSDIIKMQINNHIDVYPEFKENVQDILQMVDVEQKKYKENLKRGEELIRRVVEDLRKHKKYEIDSKTLMMLYESHGLLPRDIQKFGSGMIIELGDIETKIAVQKSEVKVPEEKKTIDLKDIHATKKIYYEKERLYESKSKVLKVIGDAVILDQTIFYPKGGGAEPDLGFINNYKVFNVEKEGNVILHFMEKPRFRTGQEVVLKINKDRREQIRKHHTAIHIIGGAARQILGNHVWQVGTNKGEDKAHIDITHYDALTPEQIEKIEKLANQIVGRDLKINKKIMTRYEAEKKYGFRIYQGGAVPGRELRIVDISTFDVEACGGIHCDSTGEVGEILILKVERPQDGTVRFVIASGEAAKKHLEERALIFDGCVKILKSNESKFLIDINKLIEEWKERKKRLEISQLKSAKKKMEKMEFEEKNGLKYLITEVHASLEELKEISRNMSEDDTVIILFGISDRIYVFGSAGKLAVRKNVDIGSIVKEICAELGGSGGGYPGLAQGFGKKKEKIKEAIITIKKRFGI